MFTVLATALVLAGLALLVQAIRKGQPDRFRLMILHMVPGLAAVIAGFLTAALLAGPGVFVCLFSGTAIGASVAFAAMILRRRPRRRWEMLQGLAVSAVLASSGFQLVVQYLLPDAGWITLIFPAVLVPCVVILWMSALRAVRGSVDQAP